MGKAILDIFIEKGYPYDLNINMDTPDGTDLETDYSCYFECASVGSIQLSVANNRYETEISAVNTNKMVHLEDYVVYVIETATSKPKKLLTGRLHIDKKVRS